MTSRTRSVTRRVIAFSLVNGAATPEVWSKHNISSLSININTTYYKILTCARAPFAGLLLVLTRLPETQKEKKNSFIHMGMAEQFDGMQGQVHGSSS